jgi:ubiquinone/menaquinone biosynthesis C-methylase UbiE
MKIEQAIRLINNPGISVTHPTAWAEFGAGTGVFTRALACIIAPGSTIMAIDKDSSALQQINLPDTVMLVRRSADFTTLELPQASLDGMLMANALHFVKNKESFLKRAAGFLRKDGIFIIVEYDLNRSNPWVPYPVSFDFLSQIFRSSIGISIGKIGETPSVFNRGVIYGCWGKMNKS